MLRPLFRLLAPFTLASTLALAATDTAAPALSADEAAAVQLYAAKDPAAQTAFAAILAREPQNAVAAFHLGALARERREFDTAVRQLELAARLAPENATYQLELGLSYGDSANGKGPLDAILLSRKSKACYDRALQLDPDNFTAHVVLLNYYRDMPVVLGGDPQKAWAHARELCRIDPVQGLDPLIELAINQKNLDEAWSVAEALHRAEPELKPALFQLGRIATLTGRNLDRGAAYLREYLQHTPAPGDPTLAQAHWRLGVIHHRQGDLSAARAEYQAALALDPASQQARDSLQSLE